MSSKRTTSETKKKFSQQIIKKISGMFRNRILLDNARDEYYSLVDGTEYGPSKEGFAHFLQANYGIEVEQDPVTFGITYEYKIIDEKKHTLFLLKFGNK